MLQLPGKWLQALKVAGFRAYYRIISALTWRGHVPPGPFVDLRIPVTEAATIKARLYNNALGANKPLIVYLHGGGWVIGDIKTHHPFCQALSAATGCSVIALDYRLAPEHVFPAAQDDCLAATQWIARHAAQLGTCNGRLVIAGDSAGGLVNPGIGRTVPTPASPGDQLSNQPVQPRQKAARYRADTP